MHLPEKFKHVRELRVDLGQGESLGVRHEYRGGDEALVGIRGLGVSLVAWPARHPSPGAAAGTIWKGRDHFSYLCYAFGTPQVSVKRHHFSKWLNNVNLYPAI